MVDHVVTSAADAPVLFAKPDPHVALVTINRPAARNAVNGAVAELLESFVRRVEDDPAIRVAIIAGAGPSFCAGADLKEIRSGRAASLSRPGSGFAGFVYAERRKPWIAAVQGAAHGGGTEIALASDLIVATRDSSFGLTEVRRGLIAGAGGCFRLARALPRSVAIEMAVTGTPIPASRAHALGLVNRLVDSDALIGQAIELARSISAGSPLAVRSSLALTRAASNLGERELLTLQDRLIAEILAGPDMIEGATAFAEKREPVWRT